MVTFVVRIFYFGLSLAVTLFPLARWNQMHVYAACDNVVFEEHVIVEQPGYNISLARAYDIDRDGDTDILATSSSDDTIFWYENDGSQEFTRHLITSLADGANGAYAADVDGDNDIDVISSSFFDDTIAWYENDGNQNFSQNVISTTDEHVLSLVVGDIDGDGDVDISHTAGNSPYSFVWHQNDGSGDFTRIVIRSGDFTDPYQVVDLDQDGDADIIGKHGSNPSSYVLHWNKNNGSQTFTRTNIGGSFNNLRHAYAKDIDGDGDIDLVAAASLNDTVSWHQNDGDENFTQIVVDSTADGATSVYADDIDGDGDTDLLSASWYDDTVAWYSNDGSQNFTKHILTSSADVPQIVTAYDIDGDGDLDVLAASSDDDSIIWFEQTCPPPVENSSINSIRDAGSSGGDPDFSSITSVGTALSSNITSKTPTLIVQARRLPASLKIPTIQTKSGTNFKLTTKVPDADRAQSVILRVFGKTYTLKPTKDGTIYQLTQKMPQKPGTYPYTLTINYGSTTLSEKGIIKVGGTTTTTILPQLNATFRLVNDRDPSFEEWSYWAGRIVAGDKPTIPELVGAMEWQKNRGR